MSDIVVSLAPRVIARFYHGAYRCGFDEGGRFLPIGCEHKSQEGLDDHTEWFAQRNRPWFAQRNRRLSESDVDTTATPPTDT